jgi:hypothetical protein
MHQDFKEHHPIIRELFRELILEFVNLNNRQFLRNIFNKKNKNLIYDMTHQTSNQEFYIIVHLNKLMLIYKVNLFL